MTTDYSNGEVSKRALDVLVSVVLLTVTAPICLAAVVLVALDGDGPAIFRQARVGRDGRQFQMFKIRTMSAGIAPHRPQVTAVGRFLRRFSIDELPQLINVLRGEMSLVGPRPEIPELVDRYSHSVANYSQRHRMPVGITGWAQVNGLRGAGTSIQDRARYDNDYIDSWSLRRDLWILLRTVPVLSHGS